MPITSRIIVGENFKNLSKYLVNYSDIIVITDTNVEALYSKYFPSKKVISIGVGEGIKTLDTVSSIYERLLALGADRSTFILGIGGGIVCDIAGFVASTYMRGLKFGFVATTLLSQVDAGLGGKNGVNFKGFKNIVGVFRQPEFIFCDPTFLKTLPVKEYLGGLAEVIKHSLICDVDYFKMLKDSVGLVISQNDQILKRLIATSIKIKSSIVNMDEFEHGERRKLNFGHTLAHAIEKHSDLSHGEAVAVGIIFASKFSVKKGYLKSEEYTAIEDLISAYNLPIKVSGIRKMDLIDAVTKDKKKEDDCVHFIFLSSIGTALIEKIQLDELKGAINDLC